MNHQEEKERVWDGGRALKRDLNHFEQMTISLLVFNFGHSEYKETWKETAQGIWIFVEFRSSWIRHHKNLENITRKYIYMICK